MAQPKSISTHLPAGRISAACDGDIIRARGVCYASGKGHHRPVPCLHWDDIMDCTRPAPIPPQIVPGRLDGVTGPIASNRQQEEDCLYVSVTTSARALHDKNKRPVMVFFHGGAYVSGGADLDCYQPSALVQRDVVVVNVSHRLGFLGYQPIPGVAAPNLGLLDQIAALGWVQRSISAFGGDATNVTLFGQSAGADSVLCLMIADGTESLFHKAILQSAPMGVRLVYRQPMVRGLGQLAHERISGDTQPRTTNEIMLLQMELIRAARSYPHSLLTFGPVLGHAPLPDLAQVPERVRLAAQRIPILIGYTRHEGAPFAPMSDALCPFFGLPLIGRIIEWLAVWFLSASLFQWPSDKLHKQYRQAGGKSSLFQFNWCPSRSPLGAAHCIELPFLLGNWEAWKAAPMVGGSDFQHVVERLGNDLKDLWVAFSRDSEREWGNILVNGNENYGDIVYF